MRHQSQELFFELIQISTGAKKQLSIFFSDKQWSEALDIANEQAITGVLITAMEEIEDKSFLPSKPVLLQWIGNGQIIEQTAIKMEEAANAVVKYFHENGFACQILKGNAVARYYPQPLRRSSGDIDIWIDGGRKRIYDFARAFDKDGMLYGVNYHHIHFHLIEDVHIEIHVWPSFLNSPLRNHRLHRFFRLYNPTMAESMPCLAFDRVFILLHCYRHMCEDGVGLRQIMDYYYVLSQGFTQEEKIEAAKWIQKLGMMKFASGLMWLLNSVFGLKEQFMIVKPNENEGRFILNEVLLTGNMGHSDKRVWGSKDTAASRFFHNLKKDFFLVRHYPHEALWQPFFSLWLYCWRFSKGLLKDRE